MDGRIVEWLKLLIDKKKYLHTFFKKKKERKRETVGAESRRGLEEDMLPPLKKDFPLLFDTLINIRPSKSIWGDFLESKRDPLL